ncbi:MAG: response regulator [Gemmatimonadota bacterium]|nr:response regulator [Gemmatimonadota bacterium]
MRTQPATILVVEDDPEMQYLLSVVLESEGREVVTASDGASAKEALDTSSFDLVLLDLILPDLDGRTLLTRLRADPLTATVPVLVISARGGADVREDCFALGADAFIEKPFDPDVLERDVAIRLERSAQRDPGGLIDHTTGLLNRAGLAAACEGGTAEYGIALVQIDGFASLADAWGWQAAEEALGDVAKSIRSAVDDEARVGRLGGGEFVVYEPDPGGGELADAAGRVLEAVRALPFETPDGETTTLTVSVGVVDVGPELTLEEALLRARRRLFRAHEAGRNRVVATDEDRGDSAARVLVAEDDEISATILLHRLEKEGLDVVRYDNGKDAYEAALEDVPDLVILDIKMPGMDGFEVLERLRRSPAYAAVPIILLTSMGSEADVVRGFKLGADDYVLKPFSPIELSARVWRLLRRGRSETAL